MQLLQGCDECGEVKELCVCPSEQQIIETLATKVMEWEVFEVKGQKGIKVEDGTVIPLDLWNPLHFIQHAWQVADQLEKYNFDVQIYRGQGFTNVVILESTHGIELSEYEGSSFQEAICKAALKIFAADLTQR